jgi:hypothetical protein
MIKQFKIKKIKRQELCLAFLKRERMTQKVCIRLIILFEQLSAYFPT